MPIRFPLRDLDEQTVILEGALEPSELGMNEVDELVRSTTALKYRLEARKEGSFLIFTGGFSVVLDCECSRCLKAFPLSVVVEGLDERVGVEGDESVVVENDTVDLTPLVREHILLGFPQHPLCEPECRGLLKAPPHGSSSGASRPANTSSAWAALDRLKLD